MTKINTLFLAGLTALVLGATAPSAEAQGGFLRIGDDGIAVGVRTNDVAFGFGAARNDGRFRRCGGHWRSYNRRVWRNGYWDRRWVPGRVAWRYDSCGRRYRTTTRGYYDRVWIDGYWDNVRDRRRVFCRGGRCRH